MSSRRSPAACDRAGFDNVSVCDHVAVPRGFSDRMSTMWYDQVATLGWLAGITGLGAVALPGLRAAVPQPAADGQGVLDPRSALRRSGPWPRSRSRSRGGRVRRPRRLLLRPWAGDRRPHRHASQAFRRRVGRGHGRGRRPRAARPPAGATGRSADLVGGSTAGPPSGGRARRRLAAARSARHRDGSGRERDRGDESCGRAWGSGVRHGRYGRALRRATGLGDRPGTA